MNLLNEVFLPTVQLIILSMHVYYVYIYYVYVIINH